MSTCKSSFNGTIAEVPGVSVDNFESLNKRAYFLSHCHRDHTQGLTNPHLKCYLEKHNVYIYTSTLSAAIIAATVDFADVNHRVKPLELGKQLLQFFLRSSMALRSVIG
jgi:DNA cross-link repair 1C protein